MDWEATVNMRSPLSLHIARWLNTQDLWCSNGGEQEERGVGRRARGARDRDE